MNVSAYFARGVDFNEDGTFSVLRGGMNAYDLPKAPSVARSFFFFISVELDEGEIGTEHSVMLRVLNPDGTENGTTPPTSFRVERKPDAPEMVPAYRYAIDLYGMHLPSHGRYDFSVLVDGQVRRSVALYVAPRGASPVEDS